MSLLADVLVEVQRGGAPPQIAARLGVDEGLVLAAIDHGVRIGVVQTGGDSGGDSCASCPSVASPACAGCFFANRGPRANLT